MNLTLPATIHRRVPDSADGYGNETLTETGTTATYCDLQQATEQELQTDRDTFVTEYLMFLNPDEVVTGWDLIEAGGMTLEIIGDPDTLRHPWRGGADDHLEVRLRRVTG